jgi:uncharacterized damage-inducible protein DinB
MIDLRYPIGPLVAPTILSPALRVDLIAQIAAAPTLLRAAVEGLSKTQLDTPYRDGGWTVAQVVHHLPDSHLNAYARCKLAVTEDNPTVKPYLEARWAELADATGTDLEASLRLLDALHRRWTQFLCSLTEEQWKRTLRHPDMGTMTVERILALYAWHGRHHVAHITTLRQRMGW